MLKCKNKVSVLIVICIAILGWSGEVRAVPPEVAAFCKEFIAKVKGLYPNNEVVCKEGPKRPRSEYWVDPKPGTGRNYEDIYYYWGRSDVANPNAKNGARWEKYPHIHLCVEPVNVVVPTRPHGPSDFSISAEPPDVKQLTVWFEPGAEPGQAGKVLVEGSYKAGDKEIRTFVNKFRDFFNERGIVYSLFSNRGQIETPLCTTGEQIRRGVGAAATPQDIVDDFSLFDPDAHPPRPSNCVNGPELAKPSSLSRFRRGGSFVAGMLFDMAAREVTRDDIEYPVCTLGGSMLDSAIVNYGSGVKNICKIGVKNTPMFAAACAPFEETSTSPAYTLFHPKEPCVICGKDKDHRDHFTSRDGKPPKHYYVSWEESVINNYVVYPGETVCDAVYGTFYELFWNTGPAHSSRYNSTPWYD